MDNLLLYLLKVSIGILLFYIVYYLFFSRDTFYLRNRIFLLGIILLSSLIPLLKVYDISSGGPISDNSEIINEFISSGTVIGANVTNKIISYDFSNLIIWFYFLISGLFLLRGIIGVRRTFTIIRKGTVINSGFPKVVLSDFDHPPFSFFPYVVIPKNAYNRGDYPQIFAHENAHIKQWHTFDLLLTEFIISFLWFNPVVWLIKRAIVLNHEYLADEISIKESGSIKEYQYNLLNLRRGLMNVQLAHNYSSQIKNRIVMINKKPTRNYAALKSIIILPVVAILFVLFSFKPESSQTNSGNQEPLFSGNSNISILRFIGENSMYPQEAKNASDTGSFFIVLKIKKGGIVKECKVLTERSKIKVPILNEVVITAYNPNAGQNAAAIGNEHTALKKECLRVGNTLTKVSIPEWMEKDMEFAIPIKFVLM